LLWLVQQTKRKIKNKKKGGKERERRKISLWPIVGPISNLWQKFKAQAHLSPLLALFSWPIDGPISYFWIVNFLGFAAPEWFFLFIEFSLRNKYLVLFKFRI
jgi:hypothetical protein